MSTVLIVPVALALDAWLGEPKRFHPLVGFGNMALAIEQLIYANSKKNGSYTVMLLVIPPVACVAFAQIVFEFPIIDIAVLYFAIGWKSLTIHAKQVKAALQDDNLVAARQYVGYLVSRDTTEMDSIGITKGTIESVLENGNDAIFGALFWFVVAGAPGAVAYRLVNTLDAMWGYRNTRYRQFGWAAARLDDCMNYIPARLTAFSYALMGNVRTALSCWREQGSVWKSPNAGPVMASGAGSLNLSLGGPACYHGKLENRIILGTTRTPEIGDIDMALRLIQRTLLFWIVIIVIGVWGSEHLAFF